MHLRGSGPPANRRESLAGQRETGRALEGPLGVRLLYNGEGEAAMGLTALHIC